jgi:hypothetical protein
MISHKSSPIGLRFMERNSNREAGHNLKLERALNELMAARLLPNDPKRHLKQWKAIKTMPPTRRLAGGSRRVRFVAEPDDQSESAVQPAFSAISRP